LRVRPERAAGCLDEYNILTERESAVVDLLTDLRHLCRFNRYDFEDAVRVSDGHFTEEVKEETT
jgi:hypothetical protein